MKHRIFIFFLCTTLFISISANEIEVMYSKDGDFICAYRPLETDSNENTIQIEFLRKSIKSNQFDLYTCVTFSKSEENRYIFETTDPEKVFVCEYIRRRTKGVFELNPLSSYINFEVYDPCPFFDISLVLYDMFHLADKDPELFHYQESAKQLKQKIDAFEKKKSKIK